MFRSRRPSNCRRNSQSASSNRARSHLEMGVQRGPSVTGLMDRGLFYRERDGADYEHGAKSQALASPEPCDGKRNPRCAVAARQRSRSQGVEPLAPFRRPDPNTRPCLAQARPSPGQPLLPRIGWLEGIHVEQRGVP